MRQEQNSMWKTMLQANLARFFLFNRDSLYTRLNSHYKNEKGKDKRCLLILGLKPFRYPFSI